jgi:proline-specific peptidase
VSVQPSVSRRHLLATGGLLALGLALPARAKGLASIPPPTREAMVPVPGGRVYVRVNGDLTARKLPVILAHGGPGGTHVGLVEALALANERTVILYDQLDTGRSERPNDRRLWTVSRFTDELEAIRTHLAVPRWHMGGFSWGGTLALEYGARRPAALAGLILGSPLISTRSWIADTDAWRARLPPDVQATLTRCERAAVRPVAQCGAAEDAFYARHMARTARNPAVAAYAQAARVEGNDAMYRAMWGPTEFTASGTLKAYDGEPLLAKLDGRRALFVTGQYDEARPATVLAFSERAPDAELAVIPGAGHALFNDRPDETVAVLRAFLARMD